MTKAHTRSCELQDCTVARQARVIHAVYKDIVAESVGWVVWMEMFGEAYCFREPGELPRILKRGEDLQKWLRPK